jgi:hypothetical protein
VEMLLAQIQVPQVVLALPIHFLAQQSLMRVAAAALENKATTAVQAGPASAVQVVTAGMDLMLLPPIGVAAAVAAA